MADGMASFLFVSRERSLRSVKLLMRKYTPQLSKAILSRNNHFTIASDLYNENVIPELIYTSMHTVDEPELIKVVCLLTSIRIAVERDPNKFPVVLAAMKKHSPVSEIVEKIEAEYYTRERVLLMAMLFMCGLVVTVMAGVFTYYYVLELGSSCTLVTQASLDDHVLHNVSLTRNELRDGYHRCANYTSVIDSFDELMEDCVKQEQGTECFMKEWFHQWLWGGDGGSACWEEVVRVLHCLHMRDIANHIERKIITRGEH